MCFPVKRKKTQFNHAKTFSFCRWQHLLLSCVHSSAGKFENWIVFLLLSLVIEPHFHVPSSDPTHVPHSPPSLLFKNHRTVHQLTTEVSQRLYTGIKKSNYVLRTQESEFRANTKIISFFFSVYSFSPFSPEIHVRCCWKKNPLWKWMRIQVHFIR